MEWPATCNLKVKYGSSGSPITVYSLMGTLQTCILGAQRVPLFIPSPALCHDVGNDCGHGTWPDRCVCFSVSCTLRSSFLHALKHITCLWPAPVLVLQCVTVTVHNPVKQFWETVLGMFTHITFENSKSSFPSLFPSPFASHLFLLHVTC